MVERNPRLTHFVCLRCDSTYDPAGPEPLTGCPKCLQAGYPASVTPAYAPGPWKPVPHRRGMLRYGEHLPYRTFPTLGEGSTPLIDLPALAERLGVRQLWVKNEGQNPTGSHKDRLSALVVARALDLGRRTVVAASSGNQGVSLAVYAAAVGLDCEIVTTRQVHDSWREAITSTGARLVTCDHPLDRWRYVERVVAEKGYYPATNFINPPVGSNPYGVQGFKTVAFEIAEELAAQPPTVVLVPCSRGDLLWGAWQGFREAHAAGWLPALPRMVAVEPFPRIGRVLSGADYRGQFPGSTRLVSIGGTSVTYQTVKAVRESGGCAISVSDAEAAEARRALARAGVYAEASSATVLAAAYHLREQGWLDAGDRVVLIVTSHGFKGPAVR